MQALIAAAIGAVVQGLKLANTERGRKYVDQLAQKQMQILDEEGRGYLSDDAALETFYKELKILMEASENEIRLVQARKD